MKKRRIFVFLTVMMLFTMIPQLSVKAEEIDSGTCGENLTWVLDDSGTLTISGQGDMDDYTYAADVPWYSDHQWITNVVIEPGVTSIGDSAFRECDRLLSVSIPDEITKIGASAFRYCESLTEVSIPDSVMQIGDEAFYFCSSLTEVKIPDGVTAVAPGTFDHCAGLERADIPGGVTSIGGSAFAYCGKLKDVTIPAAVTEIGEYAFYECGSLPEVAIPEGVAVIPTFAFGYCDSLTSAEIPNSVTEIGRSAFEGCELLTGVEIPEQVTTIGQYAFSSCASLMEITIPDSVTSVDRSAFYLCTGLKTAKIGSGVMKIPKAMFQGCTSLTDVELPEQLEEIGEEAFWACDSLASVTLPKTVKSVGDGAFAYCDALAEILVPEQSSMLSSVDGVLFAGTDSYRSLVVYPGGKTDTSYVIPGEVHEIRKYAFAGNVHIQNVTLPETMRNVYSTTFRDCASLEYAHFLGDAYNVNWEAFYNCAENFTIYYNEGTSDWTTPEWNGYRCLPWPGSDFVDVPLNTYYSEAVRWAVDNGITAGTADIVFAPYEKCTRAQVVTFLWRVDGSLEPKGTGAVMSDVSAYKYYYKAVQWAVENGIVAGKADGRFAPNDTVTRAEFVTFLWRAMGAPEPSITDTSFGDVQSGKYYTKAILWAVETEIAQGLNATEFGTYKPCNRAQVVTFLYRAYGQA